MVEIKGEEHAKMVQLALEYDPGPPFDSGAPEEPSANTIARVHPRIRRLAGNRNALPRDFGEAGRSGLTAADAAACAACRVRSTHSGAQQTATGYITKNSLQAAYGRLREYRKGGMILGKRVGCSQNVDAPALARWEPQPGLALASVCSGIVLHPPV